MDAVKKWRGSGGATLSWVLAFEESRARTPIVLQHLLGGMNAHINLDLGIAAAQTARERSDAGGGTPMEELLLLKDDFDAINGVLGALVDDVKAQLTAIWPPLRLLDRLAGNTEDVLINFSLGKARKEAWTFATELTPLEGADWDHAVFERDRVSAGLGGTLVYRPGLVARVLLFMIRVGEKGSVRHKIDILRSASD